MTYTVPDVDAFHSRFPEFSETDDSQIEFAIADAQLFIGQNWNSQEDYTAGILFLTAHFLQTGEGAYDSEGLRSFSVGPISVSFSASRNVGDFSTTSYGTRFEALMNKNVRGALVV